MPVLRNKRHEAFCLGMSRGLPREDAYVKAGYNCDPKAVSADTASRRLCRRIDVKERLRELTGGKTDGRIAVEQISLAMKAGRPTLYRPELAEQARKLALLGLTDVEMADHLNIHVKTLEDWKHDHREFATAIARGRVMADAEVADRAFQAACGYTHDAVKIFMPAGAKEPVYAPYKQHYAPDGTVALAWLSRRQPERWRQTERVDLNVKGSMTHRLNQMTLEERGALALELAARIRQRLADAGLDENGDPITVIEHEPADEKSEDK